MVNSRLRVFVGVAAAVVVAGMALLLGCGPADSPTAAGGCDAPGSSIGADSWVETTPYVPTLFPVRQEGKWGYIDKSGRVAIDFQYDDARAFSEGMAAVKVGDDEGYIDETGALVIEPQFHSAGPFGDGLAVVWREDLTSATQYSGYFEYIDKTGKTVIPPNPAWSSGSSFSEGLAAIGFLDGGCGYIDTTGQVIIRLPWATDALDFSEGLAAVRESTGWWGYVSRVGGSMIESQFDPATEFSNGLAVVKHGKYSIIDDRGHVVTKLDYDYVSGLKEGHAAVLGGSEGAFEDGKYIPGTASGWGFMDETGTLVIPTKFKWTFDFAGGLARVEDWDGKMAYIDLAGNYVWQEQ